jgi:hypothetical protein
MERASAPICLAGSQLGEARHVCAFFNSREDEYNVTVPFIKDAFAAGDKVIHIIDPSRRGDHLQRLAAFGIDAAAKQESGQLALYDWSQTFFADGPFNADQQLELLDRALRGGREQGFPVSRYVAHAEWALQAGASVDLLLEFEARVNQMWPRYADTVICTYDLARFQGHTVIDAFRTHGGHHRRHPAAESVLRAAGRVLARGSRAPAPAGQRRAAGGLDVALQLEDANRDDSRFHAHSLQ